MGVGSKIHLQPKSTFNDPICILQFSAKWRETTHHVLIVEWEVLESRTGPLRAGPKGGTNKVGYQESRNTRGMCLIGVAMLDH